MALLDSLTGSGSGREYVLRIVADVSSAMKGVDDVAQKTTSMKDRMIGIGTSVAAGLATGAVVAFGKASVQAAAEADDAMDAVESVFGSAAQSVINFSKGTAERMGLSSQDYQMMAAQAGQALTNLGFDQGDAAKRTEDLSQRAADLSAIFGGTAPEAMDAFTKAMMGQTRGLKKYGIAIETADVEARALALGMVDAEGKATDMGKAIATQELIFEQTSKQAGAYADNVGDLGSQQDIMRAKVEDLQTELGNKLLPIILQLMETLQPILDFIVKNIDWLGPLVAGIAGLVIGIKAWTAAQLLLNVALTANPIGLIIVAVGALIGILVVAYQKVDWFREAVDAAVDAVVEAFKWLWDFMGKVFNWIKDNWPLLLGILTGPFGAAVALIVKNWDTIKQFFADIPGFLARVFQPVWDIITWPFRHAHESIDYIAKLFVNIWKWVVDSIKWLFRNLADFLLAPFKIAFDGIKWLWNHTLGGFGFTIPGWIPLIGGKEFRIPEMALGGIVTRPTLAMIGEAGPEAVIPLSQMGDSGSGGVTINVYALTNNAEVGQRVYEALLQYQRVSGRGFAS